MITDCSGGSCTQELPKCRVDHQCQNDGVCIGKYNLLCVCPWGYKGRDCSIDRNECDYNDICRGDSNLCTDKRNGVSCTKPNGMEMEDTTIEMLEETTKSTRSEAKPVGCS